MTSIAEAPARVAAGRSVPAPSLQVVVAAALLLGGGAFWLEEGFGWRQATLYLLGGAMGLVLYHALFGFTAAWRVFISDRRGAGLRAQMLLLAIASVLMLPALAEGTLFGESIVGAVAPVGISVLVGAFVFGLGMQLGGGCGSGTLYTAGGGNTRMLVVLAFFIAGSLAGTAHLPWWLERPSFEPIALVDAFGLAPTLALQLGAFAAIAGLTVLLERRRHGRLLPASRTGAAGWRRILQGPWPLVAGAVLLAVFNFATLALAGHPWGITFAFGVWGAKIAQGLGANVASWEFWTWPGPEAALSGSVFADVTSVMDFGIMAGALLAAGLAGKFAPAWRLPWRSLLAGAIGGLLMGYGARLAFGCNIGAYFSGIASSSVHGWVWFAAALVGSYAGTALRPWFGLEVERTKPAGA